MTYRNKRQTLVGFLCYPFVNKVTRTPLLGGPYVRVIDVFKVASDLYAIGAVLGRARRNRLNILARLLVVPGAVDSDVNRLMTLSQKDANNRLRDFKNQNGREPDTFGEICLFPAIKGAL